MSKTTNGSGEIHRRTYTVLEVAEILGIGRNTAYEICRTGELPTIRIGGRVLVPRAVIDELLKGAG
jgi:excisionase family DNA binding protein